MWWVRRPALKIYVGDGVLDVPEGPRNEILLRDIWQGFGTVKTVPYGLFCNGQQKSKIATHRSWHNSGALYIP